MISKWQQEADLYLCFVRLINFSLFILLRYILVLYFCFFTFRSIILRVFCSFLTEVTPMYTFNNRSSGFVSTYFVRHLRSISFILPRKSERMQLIPRDIDISYYICSVALFGGIELGNNTPAEQPFDFSLYH